MGFDGECKEICCVCYYAPVTMGWASGSLTWSSTCSLRSTRRRCECSTESGWNDSTSTSLWSIRSTARGSTSTTSGFADHHRIPVIHNASHFVLFFSSRFANIEMKSVKFENSLFENCYFEDIRSTNTFFENCTIKNSIFYNTGAVSDHFFHIIALA